MFKERAWRSVFYTAALLGVSACSAKTGGSPPGGTAGSGGASSVPPAGGLSGNGTGAGGFLTGAGDGMGGALIGSVGMPRPVDMGNGPDGSCGELPFSAEQVHRALGEEWWLAPISSASTDDYLLDVFEAR